MHHYISFLITEYTTQCYSSRPLLSLALLHHGPLLPLLPTFKRPTYTSETLHHTLATCVSRDVMDKSNKYLEDCLMVFCGSDNTCARDRCDPTNPPDPDDPNNKLSKCEATCYDSADEEYARCTSYCE